MGKSWYTSKTIWFAIATVVVGVLNMFGFAEFVPDAKSAEIIGQVLTGIGTIIALLRAVTGDPLTWS